MINYLADSTMALLSSVPCDPDVREMTDEEAISLLTYSYGIHKKQ